MTAPLVVVPATPTGLHPATVPALLATGVVVKVMPMRNELDYCRALESAWLAATVDHGPLVIVEHDVEAGPAVLRDLLACPLPWCVAPYNSHEALGCAKFDPVRLGPWPLDEGVPWLHLDHAVYRALLERGEGPHVHARHRPVHHHGWTGVPA